MRKLLLSLCTLMFFGATVLSSAQSTTILPTQALLTWVAPTTNTDGSTLAGITTYNIYYGTTSGGPYSNKVSVAGTALTTTITNLTNGTWYFVATAVAQDGVESAYSNQVSKTISLSATPTPNAPGILTVQ